MSAILTPTTPDLLAWASAQLPHANREASLHPLSGDAGNRRYYRLQSAASTKAQSFIVAHDSSPAQYRQFLTVYALLQNDGVAVPRIIARHDQKQWLLLEDFGDATYLMQLQNGGDDADTLYITAIETLVQIQKINPTPLPVYDAQKLNDEMLLYDVWYVQRHLRRRLSSAEQTLLATCRRRLCEQIVAMPQVFVHRDYHSRNLMHRSTPQKIGVLDFQDAVAGAVAYDIVSLLRDAYIRWTHTQQKKWLRCYWQLARARGVPVEDDFQQHWRSFNRIGIQRGLKVVGIFCRLAYRDGKQQFLDDIDLAYQHLLDACAALVKDDASVAALLPLLKTLSLCKR